MGRAICRLDRADLVPPDCGCSAIRSLDLYLQDARTRSSELVRAVTLAAGAHNPAEAGSATPAHVPTSDGPTDSLTASRIKYPVVVTRQYFRRRFPRSTARHPQMGTGTVRVRQPPQSLTVYSHCSLAVYARHPAAPTSLPPTSLHITTTCSVIAQESRVPAQLDCRSQTADIFACTPLSRGLSLVAVPRARPAHAAVAGENSATVNLPSSTRWML